MALAVVGRALELPFDRAPERDRPAEAAGDSLPLLRAPDELLDYRCQAGSTFMNTRKAKST